MNPTDMSGDDLCEQPILQPTELRALAGLGALALLLFVGIQTMTPLTSSQNLPATAVQPTIEQPAASYQNDLEWTPVLETPAESADVMSSTTPPTIESVD